MSKIHLVYRFLLTAVHEWAEPDPPERIQENVARITLYSTSQRQVKAVPRTPPVKDLGETAGSPSRKTNRSASACKRVSE